MIKIIPALLPKSWQDLVEKIESVAPLSSRVQIDIVDGNYAPEATWPYHGSDQSDFTALREQKAGLPRWKEISFEVDLLIEKPEETLDQWIDCGFETLIVHVETTEQLGEVVKHIKERGAEVALALKPSTPIEVLEPFIPDLSFIQCMGNDRVGYHGVSLDPVVLDKIRTIKTNWPDRVVGIDIGVSLATVPALVEAGATHIATWSALMRAEVSPLEALKRLEEKAQLL